MRTITNLGTDLNRDITNGADLDILEADLPLTIVEDPTGESNDTINLGGLSSYGASGQVMKVNTNADGLEWADDDDTTYSGGTNISIDQTNSINLDSTITLDRLNMTEGNAIFFKGSNDLNHFIRYVFDGVEIGGFGSNDAPFFQVVNTQPLADTPPGVPIPVFQVYQDKIISKKQLDMTSQPVYFKESDLNHYIKYQSVGDCVELASYSSGADDDVVFQFVNSAVASPNNPNLVLFNKENNSFVKATNFQSDVTIYNAKKLLFNDSSATTQSNYIKYNDTYDSMEISGSGLGGTASVLRIASPNATGDLLCDFETTKTTITKQTTFNSSVAIDTNLTITNDLFVNDIASVVNIDATGEITCDSIVSDYLTVVQNIDCGAIDCSVIDCDSVTSEFITVSDDVRIGKELNMRDNTNLGQINMADGPIYWRNGYKTGTDTYATDTNHYSQYNGFPVDGIRHQGWNGVALGYTNGGPGTALYTNGTVVRLGNGDTVTSDDRIKFNESRITDALSTINKLVVMEYDKHYNRDLYETQYEEEMTNHLLNDTAKKEYGYIAQDTWNNIPELRFTIDGVDETIPENFDEDGRLIEDCKIRNKNQAGEEFIDRKYLSLDYNNINTLNVRAVQELSAIVSQQQAQIDRQTEQLDRQQEQIEMLFEKLNNLDIR